MDTKWRKSKGILGLLIWFGGIYLIIFILLAAVSIAMTPNAATTMYAAAKNDYHQMEEFKNYMEARLGRYIGMAEEEIAVRYDAVAAISAEPADAVTIIAEDDNSIFEIVEENDNIAYYEVEAAVATEAAVTDASAYHAILKKDKNVLYTIAYDGEILFTNEDSLGFFEEEQQLPEGYSLQLHFDGERVIAKKNGKETIHYGTYPTGEEQRNIQVYMAVIDEPYVITEGENRFDALKGIQVRMQVLRNLIVMCVLMAAGAVLFLLLSHHFRVERRYIQDGIARRLWRILYEPKILVLLGLLGLANAVLIRVIDLGGYFGNFAEGEGWFLSGGILFVYMILWLIYIDGNKEEKIWKHSILMHLISFYHKSSKRYPAGVRMMKRISFIFTAEIISSVLFIIWMYQLSDNTPYIMIMLIIMVNLILVFVQVSMWNTNKRLAEDMDLLLEQIEIVHGGELMEELTILEDSDIAEAAEKLNDISRGMLTALEEQMRSERMKLELVTNVSHDIKTPLTSIISYVELLKQEQELPVHVKEYILILESKSRRLKTMVQDVFEVSKAASGQLPVHIELLDLGKLMRQTLADMEESIRESGFIIKEKIEESSILIEADGERLYRVFQNLIVNALKYSLEGTRIYIDVEQTEETATASIKNTSRDELQQGVDFTERFLRGDGSRTDGGSGLGLSIARSFTEACGGELRIETNADLFVVTVRFTAAGRAEAVEAETETSITEQS